MRVIRAWRLPAIVVVAALLGGCGIGSGDQNSVVGRADTRGRLTIGIRFDQPGLGYRRLDGRFEGFDVDVARYVAHELGVADGAITWKETQPADREKMLQNGQVDMVVAAYTITEKRKQLVDFAGPYFTVGQDLLVRLTDHTINGPQDLNGRKLCSVAGSTSAQQVQDKYAKGTQLVQYNRYSDCVTALLAGIVDAVTTDDVILAGYAAQDPELLRVVGKPFTKEQYGIGVRKGDSEAVRRIDEAVQKMIQTGAWKDSLQRNVGPSGYPIPQAPAVAQ
ncbi:glutamate ABC transporter substrate-binding protein [Gandjariella thermophila]|uniref:ABC transporter substrate-binding protein n=1 Tax=Gandjariella thermophila TaxID=1931992 RepID=A0A4D4J377_9PSEU|nr:glutamate ABC transporter substrate-binding protein [Gandjariella thermophila]GDY29532.1 ABC transporter substrate-binding protein [Gandjariella thermophila]